MYARQVDQEMASDGRIDEAILEAILAGRLAPGTRLGEVQLGEIFGVSRTRVREALMKLETRGIVRVNSRRGWFVVEPSAEEARAAFQARRVVETGLILTMRGLDPAHAAHLRAHLAEEEEAVVSGDIGSRTCSLGDFHIHLAEATGNPLLVDILRDLTARTTLVSMLYQSTEEAAASHGDHTAIFAALEAGDFAEASRLMVDHIDDVEDGLDLGVRRIRADDLRALLLTDASPARLRSS